VNVAVSLFCVFTISCRKCASEHYYRVEERERERERETVKMSIHHADGNKRRKNKKIIEMR